jgi:flagellar basal body-associated protein FliL
MTRTNSSRSSSVVLAALVVLLAATVPAAAVSVTGEDVPAEAQVDRQVSATVTLEELYQNPQSEQWQLSGETALTDVSWTVVFYDQTGSQVNLVEPTGQSFSGIGIAANSGTAEVEVRVTGTVPGIDSYSYDPAQEFLLMELTRGQEGGASSTIDSWQTHHYTERSASARDAIDQAGSAIESARESGANPADAQADYEDAIAAYNDGSFDVASNLADRATEQATQAQESQRTQRLIIYAVVALLVVALLVGAVVYWRSQQGPDDPLG